MGPQNLPERRGIPLDGYRRALRFIVPYWPRLVFVLLAGVAATGFGLLQPYISKLLIDDALLKHNLRMLLIVSGLMFGVTVLGFVLNILSSYQYVRVSAWCFLICVWRCTSICKRFRRASGRAPSWAMWSRALIMILPRCSASRPTVY